MQKNFGFSCPPYLGLHPEGSPTPLLPLASRVVQGVSRHPGSFPGRWDRCTVELPASSFMVVIVNVHLRYVALLLFSSNRSCDLRMSITFWLTFSHCSPCKALSVDWEALVFRGFKTLRLVLTASNSRGNPASS